jgi:2-succinyl-5-enolpyruvyl-6-hydroxy-3-cyclohexene-1-carboxylate synthase
LAKVNSRLKNKRGVIIAGARGVPPRAAKLLSDALKWPVLADPTSGCRTEGPHAIRHADALLRDSEIAKRLRPESVLRFGALPASKVVNSWLRDTAAEVTTVSGSPYLIDPDRTTSLHLVTNAEALCTDLAPLVAPCDQNWLQDWCVVEQSARRVVGDMLDDETRLSEPGVARCVVASLPTGSRFVVSSSMPIRDVEWYGGSCEHLTVLSNRGANGIDGVVSTAVGVALETGQTTGLLIGDIAFLHDSNGLIGLARRGADVRIVVVDNNGGGIFSFLPQRTSLPGGQFETIFGTPHESDASLIARAHGVRSCEARTTAELRQALAEVGPSVIVVKADRDKNVEHHDEIHRAVAEAVRGSIKV